MALASLLPTVTRSPWYIFISRDNSGARDTVREVPASGVFSVRKNLVGELATGYVGEPWHRTVDWTIIGREVLLDVFVPSYKLTRVLVWLLVVRFSALALTLSVRQ